jgi:hypothetical protein
LEDACRLRLSKDSNGRELQWSRHCRSHAARRLHKVELIESCTKLSDSKTVEAADTGGLLRALARRPHGRAAWPEYEDAFRGRSDAAAEVHCRSRAGEHDLIEKRVLCAYHEAGHAVVAVVLGMRLERVTLGANGTGSRCRTLRPKEPASLRQVLAYAATHFGGGLAEGVPSRVPRRVPSLTSTLRGTRCGTREGTL